MNCKVSSPPPRVDRRRPAVVLQMALALTLVTLLPAAATSRTRIAVYRPTTGDWDVRADDGSLTRVRWGDPGDLPVARDYDGQGRAQIAVFRPSAGAWFIRQDDGRISRATLGAAGDIPVPGDYLGLGRA